MPLTDESVVRRLPTDGTLTRYSTLRRVDHVDAHLVRTGHPGSRTPEQWAREILENTPRPTHLRLQSGWATLGLMPALGDHPAVAGWKVIESNGQFIRLQRDSRVGLTGQLFTRVTEEGVEFATSVELRNAAVRTLWAAVLPTHLTVVASLLEQAAARTHS